MAMLVEAAQIPRKIFRFTQFPIVDKRCIRSSRYFSLLRSITIYLESKQKTDSYSMATMVGCSIQKDRPSSSKRSHTADELPDKPIRNLLWIQDLIVVHISRVPSQLQPTDVPAKCREQYEHEQGNLASGLKRIS